MSAKRPSTCGLIASRSNAPAHIRANSPLLAEMQKSAPAGIRPIRPNDRPVFRPDVPCETQQSPDLNAPGGRPDRSFTPGPGSIIPGIVCNVIGGELIPCPTAKTAGLFKKGQVEINQITSFFKRQKQGKPAVDPLTLSPDLYQKQLKQLGLMTTRDGKVIEKKDAGKTNATAATSEGNAP